MDFEKEDIKQCISIIWWMLVAVYSLVIGLGVLCVYIAGAAGWEDSEAPIAALVAGLLSVAGVVALLGVRSFRRDLADLEGGDNAE